MLLLNLSRQKVKKDLCMKRFMLVLALFGMICLSANAGEIVYSNTGRPAYHINGYGQRRDFNNFGSNAAFLPRNTMGYRYNRRLGYDMNGRRGYAQPGMRNEVSAPVRPIQVSRFDKGYQISTRRSYTKNGITYYN